MNETIHASFMDSKDQASIFIKISLYSFLMRQYSHSCYLFRNVGQILQWRCTRRNVTPWTQEINTVTQQKHLCPCKFAQ